MIFDALYFAGWEESLLEVCEIYIDRHNPTGKWIKMGAIFGLEENLPNVVLYIYTKKDIEKNDEYTLESYSISLIEARKMLNVNKEEVQKLLRCKVPNKKIIHRIRKITKNKWKQLC